MEIDKLIKGLSLVLPGRIEDLKHSLYPQSLFPEEIANPHVVIGYFLLEYDVPTIKKYISGWMTAVYEKVGWIKRAPNDIIYFTERLLRIIEAAWLVNEMENTQRLANLSLQYDLDKMDWMDPKLFCPVLYREYGQWDHFPRSLNKKEYSHPYKVFSKFFKFHTLAEWNVALHQLLTLALSDIDIADSSETINILAYKKRLDKFIEACHLIHVREFEWASGQLIQKIYHGKANE